MITMRTSKRALYIPNQLVGTLLRSGFTSAWSNDGAFERMLHIISRFGHAMPSEQATQSHGFVQVVPTVLLRCIQRGQVFVTRAKEDEATFFGPCELGIPGIMQCDQDYQDASSDILDDSFSFEDGCIIFGQVLGLLYDDESTADRQRLGVVTQVCVDADKIRLKNKRGMIGAWMDIEQIKSKNGDAFSNWSKHLFKHLLLEDVLRYTRQSDGDEVTRDIPFITVTASLNQNGGYSMSDFIQGVQPDMPVRENENGGKQSDSPYGFHLLPVHAMFAAAQTAKEGADKYGETRTERNYTKISVDDHICHCLQHLYAYLAGDTSDLHLSHAIVRAMFAYECDMLGRGEDKP